LLTLKNMLTQEQITAARLKYGLNKSIATPIASATATAANAVSSVADFINQMKIAAAGKPLQQTPTKSITPLGTSPIASVVSGIAKSGLNVLKSASSIGEKIIRTPVDIASGKSLSQSWNAPTGAEKIQSTVEQNKGVAPGTLLQGANPIENIAKTATDIAGFFVPGGLEKGAITKADDILNTPKLIETFGEHGANIIKNILKVATGGATAGTSMAGVTALEGGNAQDIKNSALWGGIAGVASKVIGLAAPTLMKSLAESSFKLTPTMAAKATSKVEAASKFVGDNGLSMNPVSQYKQLTGITVGFENSLQSSLPKNIGVAPENLIAEINKIPEQFRNEPAIYQEVKNSAAKAIKTINETHQANISLNDLLSGKRSYGISAFGKTSPIAKATGVISEGDYAIEKAYQNTLENTLAKTKGNIKLSPDIQKYFGGKTEVSLPEFTKVYSQAINAKKFANLAQVKNDSHLVGRLFGLWAGESVGNAIMPGLGGKIIGGMTGEILSNKLPTAARSTAATLIKQSPKIVPAAKIGIGASNNR